MSTSPTKDDSNTAGDTGSSARTSVPSSKKFACVLCRRRKLKCDGAKPACATCSRLKHHCSYQDDGPKKPTVKRRNIRDLEARLAQVEGRLTVEQAKRKAEAAAYAGKSTNQTTTFDDDQTFDDDEIMQWNAGSESVTAEDMFGTNPSDPILDGGKMFSNSVLPLGMDEALPPQDVQDRLYRFYLEKINGMTPFIHAGRFRASLEGPPHMRPALCLRYAIMALTSLMIDSMSKYKEIFYLRARKYAEQDELKGHGESFITIEHAQTWILLCNYEVRTMAFPRAWISTGRAVRLVQMMGLDRLDHEHGALKKTIPPTRDLIELETRRRTFWGAYCSDRWASAGTGWCMTILDENIQTNLPCSEKAFREGTPEEPLKIAEVYSAEGLSKMSSYGGAIFMANLFGRNINHMHRGHENDNPSDYQTGDFWMRHRSIDNILSTVVFCLPQFLKVPQGLRDPNGVFINMNIHCSIICLHQAAIVKAEENDLGFEIVGRSRLRCQVAAEEIVNIMRLCSSLDVSDINPWVCFSLYVAAQVFLESCKRRDPNSNQYRYNLEFVLGALQIMRYRHGVVDAFITQLKADMEAVDLSGDLNSNISQNQSAYICALGTGAQDPNTLDRFEAYVQLPDELNSLTGKRWQPAAYIKPAVFSLTNQNISSASPESATNMDTPSDKSDSQTPSSGLGNSCTAFALPTRLSQHSSPAAQGSDIPNDLGVGKEPQVLQSASHYPMFIRHKPNYVPPASQGFIGQETFGTNQTTPTQSEPTRNFSTPVSVAQETGYNQTTQLTGFQDFNAMDPNFVDPSQAVNFDFTGNNDAFNQMMAEVWRNSDPNNGM